MYYAHSGNDNGKWQLLIDHLIGTANLMLSFAHSESLQKIFYLTGLLHDAGKYQTAFQRYLKAGGGEKVPHAVFGALISRRNFKKHLSLPYVIDGHHAGIPDTAELKTHIQEIEDGVTEYDTVYNRWKSELEKSLSGLDTPFQELSFNGLELELFTRYLFSALTDADWLDTERHFSHNRSDTRIQFQLDHDLMLNQLSKYFAGLPTEGPINKLRTRARNEAATHAEEKIGFFSLMLPTGLGKTLTSLYWALLHAKHHRLHRIIIVLPFINIIDQTASLLKNIFGDDLVLEHHSGIIAENDSGEQQGFEPKRLACENWDFPIIITTSVQFFESLFSNRKFKCRKFHNISDSVVIFDEIQTLPKTISEPTVIMLKNVCSVMNASMLFCTATLPAFQKRDGFDGIEPIVPLISDVNDYFHAADRVRFILHNNCEADTIENVAEAVSNKNESVLLIANTKKIAKELFSTISMISSFEKIYHLSTAMCPNHRRSILSSIKTDLEERRYICVVSTQLIEAGVDIDFPCVFRALAPLDGIIQSAGRCNRNGILGKKGVVVIYDLENSNWPDPSYKACAQLTKTKLRDVGFLTDYRSFGIYYADVLKYLVDKDKSNINDERKKFNFQSVNDRYHVIHTPTAPLFIINYNDESKILFESMAKAPHIPRSSYRKAQEYTVLVYPDFLTKYSDQIETFQNTIYIWHGEYDIDKGLVPDNKNIELYVC